MKTEHYVYIGAGVVVLGVAIAVGVYLVKRSKGVSAGGAGTGWEAGSGVLLNDKQRAFLDRLHEETGLYYYVTSGIRTPRDQARALLRKLELGETVNDLLALYKRDDLVRELAGVPQTEEAWADVIEEQISRGDYLSSHLGTEKWGGEALDLRSAGGGEGAVGQLSTKQQQTTVNAIQQLGARPVVEGTPPHIHVELRGFKPGTA